MAIFHAKPGRGRITHLVLQDAQDVWGRAVDGVLKLDDAAAARFRAVAHLYGYEEQNPPKPVKRAAAKDAE